jgi:hypothetical protein
VEMRKAEVLSGGLVPVAGERIWTEGVGRWKWYKYCVHIHINGKIRAVETILGMGGGGIKKDGGD